MDRDFTKLVLTKSEKRLFLKFRHRKVLHISDSDSRQLELKHLIQGHCIGYDDIGNPTYDGYEISLEGERYIEFLKIQRRNFWSRNIFTPIIVSVVTTLLTLLISRLLEWVL